MTRCLHIDTSDNFRKLEQLNITICWCRVGVPYMILN